MNLFSPSFLRGIKCGETLLNPILMLLFMAVSCGDDTTANPDLSGIKYLTNLTALYISNNEIKNIL